VGRPLTARWQRRPRVTRALVKSSTGETAVADQLVQTLKGKRSFSGPRLSENQDPAEQVAFYKHWIYAAVNARAKAVAQTPLRFFVEKSDGSMEGIRASNTGPGLVVKLFKKPNPHQTLWQFLYINQVFADLTGDYYIYKEPNTLGRTIRLWTAYPQFMKIRSSGNGVPSYVYTRGSKEVTFDADEIAHGLYPDPQSEWYGLSPLQAATQAVNVHEAIFESQQQAFEQGIEPSAVLSGPADADAMEPDQIDHIEESLYKKHKGKNRHGKVLILEGGLKLTPYSMSPREMNWLQSANLSRDQILGIYSTPAAIAGLSKDVNRSSAEAMEFIFAKWTVSPILRQWEDLINMRIVADFDERIIARFDSVIPQDKDAESARAEREVKGSIITPNEARRRVGADRFADDNADLLWADANRVPLGTERGEGE